MGECSLLATRKPLREVWDTHAAGLTASSRPVSLTWQTASSTASRGTQGCLQGAFLDAGPACLVPALRPAPDISFLQRRGPLRTVSAGPDLVGVRIHGAVTFQKATPSFFCIKGIEHKHQVKRSPGLFLQAPRERAVLRKRSALQRMEGARTHAVSFQRDSR